jgi:hypothetical protein
LTAVVILLLISDGLFVVAVEHSDTAALPA